MKHHDMNARTRAKIQRSFLTLMAHKGYHQVTITDIIGHADISRGTFYLHYLDKPDLLEKIEDKFIDEIRVRIDDTQPSPYRSVISTFDWFYENREALRILAGENGDANFVPRLVQLLIDRTTVSVQSETSQSKFDLPIYYALDLYITGFVHMIFNWLIQPVPESPSEFTEIFLAAEHLSPDDLLRMIRK
jgi:AcrR family transcriptional regulator